MIHIAVCDDDKEMGKCMGNLAEDCCRNLGQICKSRLFTDGNALLYEAEDGAHFDLLLLDIEMPELDGMSLATAIRRFLPEVTVIFVTSYGKYVYEAFKVQPYRYVIKGQIQEMLPEAVGDAVRKILDEEGKFYIAENQWTLEKIYIRNIVYIWHKDKYAYIEKLDGTQTKVRKTLRQVYGELPEGDFVWADVGCIMALAQIERITNEEIFLRNGEKKNFGREKMTEIKGKHPSQACWGGCADSADYG